MIDMDIESNPAEADKAGNKETPPFEEPFIYDPKRPKFETPEVWRGWDGIAVMTFGAILPLVMIAVYGATCFERICRLAFKHPAETLVECLLVVIIPFANYFAWSALRNNDRRHSVKLNILNGTGIATSLAIAAFSAATVFLGHPVQLVVVSGLWLCAAGAGGYIAYQVRNEAETRLSKDRRVLYSVAGIALSIIGLVGAEARGLTIRYAESLALSTNIKQHEEGMNLLHKLDCEQDIRMQCADERTAGIPGVFFRINEDKERQLYFQVTGKPYGNSLTDSVYSMSDDYLRRHVVGDVVPELSLVRSAITGFVNSQTLTSNVEWTYVFKNNSFNDQEARAEIAIPQGSVVSGLTLWSRGEPVAAAFASSYQSQSQNENWVNVSNEDPALITDLGRGRVLLKCSGVPAQDELKVRMTITSRLKPESPAKARLTLPKFVATNFSLADGSHALRLHSTEDIESGLTTLRRVKAADGGTLLEGSLSDKNLTGTALSVMAARKPSFGPFAVEDKWSANGGFIIEKLQKITAVAPDHLVVVVDASASMKEHAESLSKALEAIPNKESTSIILAADGVKAEPMPLNEGLKRLKETPLRGGENNLEAVIKAAEIAGDTKSGAVLWVHGPQPSFNHEIYIMAPYIAKPRFYEMALDEGYTDTNEFFRNHREIGPFTQIPRNGSIAEDMKDFVAKWQPGGFEYGIKLERTGTRPALAMLNDKVGEQISKLCARDEAYQLMRESRLVDAGDLASTCGLVTPVSSAIVLAGQVKLANNDEGINDPVRAAKLQGAANGVSQDEQQTTVATAAPALQGATNGTISGVNTAGTVRVNNLANLEALLNVLANFAELGGILLGGFLLARGAMNAPTTFPVQMSRPQLFAVGAAIILAGLAVPGCINWLVASARDANLFS